MSRVFRWLLVTVLIGGLVAAGAVGALLVTTDPDEPDGPEPSRATASTADGWRIVSYAGLTVEVPRSWTRLDTSGCETRVERWGRPSADPCSGGAGLWFRDSATFDPLSGPGVHKAPPSESLPDGGWMGYVTRGDVVVDAADADREVVRRVLRSVSRPA